MTTRSHGWIAMMAAALSLACGGGDAERAGKPQATAGGEAERPVAPVWEGPTTPGRPATARDVVLRAFGDTPTGPISADALSTYLLNVEIRNRSAAPIRIDPAFLHVSVYRGALLIEGCTEPNPRALEIGEAIAPGASEFVAGPLPCPLTEPGRYDVVVVLITGHETEAGALAPVNARTSASTQLVIDDALPPVGGGGVSDP